MEILIILGAIAVSTVGILAYLFITWGREVQESQESKVEQIVPVANINQIQEKVSGQVFDGRDNKIITQNDEIIPVLKPQNSNVDHLHPPIESTIPTAEDEAYRLRAMRLEEELIAISKQSIGRSAEDKQLIETLTKENETLNAKIAQQQRVSQRLDELEGQEEVVKSENSALQSKIDSYKIRVENLENELKKAESNMLELAREKQAILDAPKADQDAALRHEMETLKNEYAQFQQKYAELEKAHQELLSEKHTFDQKIDAMQYELIKARAQTSGLERMSFNYKNQLEDFFKKINAVKITNESLMQEKNRLEGMIDEVKNQNEELVKREHLSQFEIEKTRSRIQELEREYDSLKAKVSGGNT